jgi:hypothetical protein
VGGREAGPRPATKWPWSGELGDRGYLIAAARRDKNLLMTGEVADLLDPICRAEITRMRAADPGRRRLLDHLANTGPASIEDLRTELRLKRQELTALRAALERCGAIIVRSLQVTAGEGHQHARRADPLGPGPPRPGRHPHRSAPPAPGLAGSGGTPEPAGAAH